MILLGFQPLLYSVKVRYFLLKSDGVLRLENRLPKRHGGSNPSSCATLTLEKPSVFKGFLYVFMVYFQKSLVEPKGIFKLVICLAVSFGQFFVVFYEKNKTPESIAI